MNDTLLIITLILIIILAIMVVTVDKLLKAVVMTAIFSVMAAFVYLILGAPDVALAEAVIGSTLSTIILLVAIKRCKIFTVYYISETNIQVNKSILKVVSIIENALKEHEIEPNIICSTDSIEILQKSGYDIIVEYKKSEIIIHGKENSFNMESIINNINKTKLRYSVHIEDNTNKKVYKYKG